MYYNEYFKTCVAILGSMWAIYTARSESDPLLEERSGYCDWTSKTIVIIKPDEGTTLADIQKFENRILRHEIVHAFLSECGLDNNSNQCDAWAANEEMTDWFAAMGERIYKAWKEAGALDEPESAKKTISFAELDGINESLKV